MLVAAPEGTCGDGRGILQFRSGCFLPGVPLLPILFKYNISCQNPAWTIINEGWHFVRSCAQSPLAEPCGSYKWLWLLVMCWHALVGLGPSCPALESIISST